MRKIISILLLLVSFQLAAKHNIEEILSKIDKLYRSSSSHAELRMEIITPHWQRELRMDSWSLGTEKSLIKIKAPKKERGVGSLKLGNEMWNYLPRTNKVIKIPPSMMMSSWMGSDFTNDDLVKEYTFREDYNFSFINSDEKDKLLIKCVPKEGRPIIWGHLILKVRESDYLPVKQEYYDENGKRIRVMKFRKIKEFDGKKIPAVLELIPLTKKGEKTIVEYLDVEFNLNLNERMFSLRNLRRGL